MPERRMQPLFSPAGEKAIVATLKFEPLLAFDFDGTLAPIVAKPDDARVLPALAPRLERLAAQLPLAIVSGRSVDDVRKRLSFVPRFIVGNHGAEDETSGPAAASADLDVFRTRLLDASAALAADGIQVEDKRYSIALHYRRAADQQKAHALIAVLTDNLPEGLKAFGGKLVVNVVAASAPDKAGAVQALLARSGARSVVFVGDDLNDEPVFIAAQAGWLTVRVGRDALGSKARFWVEGLDDVALLLDRMLAWLDARASRDVASVP